MAGPFPGYGQMSAVKVIAFKHQSREGRLDETGYVADGGFQGRSPFLKVLETLPGIMLGRQSPTVSTPA